MSGYRKAALLFIIFGWAAIIGFQHGCGEPFVPICMPEEPTEAYIVGGVASDDRRSSVYTQTATGYCSGSIVGPHTVLTAGHCEDVTDISVDDIGWFEAAAELAHEGFTFPRHDLRLVYFEDILPPPYATIATGSLTCSTLLVQGYGIGGDGSLHEREVTQVNYYGSTIVITQGACNGDSGGGLYADDVLLGVTSWGYGEKPECAGLTGFVDLRQYSQWLEESIH